MRARGLGERFHFYARRVCSLQFGAYNPKGIVSAPVAKYWADTKDLFPRLTRLLLTDNDAIYSQHTLLNFLRPTLTKVHMIAHSAQYDALLSSCVHNSLRHLKSFEFDLIVPPEGDTNIAAWQDLVTNISSLATDLRQLTIRIDVRYQDLLAFSEHPTLCDLNLRRIEDIPSIPGYPGLSVQPFAGLCELVVDEAMRCDQAVSLISFHPSVLEWCWLIIEEVSSFSELMQLAEQLGHHTRLTIVMISFTVTNDFAAAETEGLKFLLPLHAINQLEIISLWTPFAFSVSSECFLKIFASWPRLVGFDITFTSLSLSIPDLFTFLRTHPAFRRLPSAVTISARGLASRLSVEPALEFQAHPLSGPLYVQLEEAEDLDALKQVAKELLPHVSRLHLIGLDEVVHLA
jgi:hypothetical protein